MHYQSAPFPADGEFDHHVAVAGPEKNLCSAQSQTRTVPERVPSLLGDESHPHYPEEYRQILNAKGIVTVQAVHISIESVDRRLPIVPFCFDEAPKSLYRCPSLRLKDQGILTSNPLTCAILAI